MSQGVRNDCRLFYLVTRVLFSSYFFVCWACGKCVVCLFEWMSHFCTFWWPNEKVSTALIQIKCTGSRAFQSLKKIRTKKKKKKPKRILVGSSRSKANPFMLFIFVISCTTTLGYCVERYDFPYFSTFVWISYLFGSDSKGKQEGICIASWKRIQSLLTMFFSCRQKINKKERKKKKKRASHGVQSVIATPYVLTIQATQPFVPEG